AGALGPILSNGTFRAGRKGPILSNGTYQIPKVGMPTPAARVPSSRPSTAWTQAPATPRPAECVRHLVTNVTSPRPNPGGTRMRRRPVPPSASGAPVDGVRRVLLALAFALFDREAGHRRKVVAGGLGALLLMGATHAPRTAASAREA